MSDEARQELPTVITPYRDGPLLVRGPVRIQDQDGSEMTVDREIVALCRCGKSRLKPLCDGTHKLIRFEAPSGMEAAVETCDSYRSNGSGNGSNGHRK